MAQRTRALIDEIARTEQKLATLKGELASIQAACRHAYGEPEYVPEYHEGYRIPGDPPGWGGSNRGLALC